MFINRYRPVRGRGGGWGGSVILVQHNLSIIPPVEHNSEHNTLVSRVTPESIILYFSSIIWQTLYSKYIQVFLLKGEKREGGKYNVPVKSKLEHPPPGIPWAFDAFSCPGGREFDHLSLPCMGHLIASHRRWGI